MQRLRATKVLDGDGRRWKVRRRWLPWRRRVRDVPDVPLDVGDLGDDPISAIIGIFLLVLAIPAIVVTLLLLAELLLLLLLLPLFVAIRLALPVPWTLELWSRPEKQRFLGWHLEHEVPVSGWAASQERLATMAGEIAAGGRDGRYVPDGARVPAGVEPREEPEGDDAVERSADTSFGPPTGGTVARTATDDGGATPNPFAQRDER